jgi:hypothetical protein
MILIKLLLILLIANGAPVITHCLLGRHLSLPVDGGLRFLDGKPLLGPSKTVRGVAAAIIASTTAAALLGIAPAIGALIGLLSMLGDLSSSFVKRRLGLASSQLAHGLDQIPEALFPLLVVRTRYDLGWMDIAVVVASFFAVEVILSRLFRRFPRRR